jgi:hypothetical protein
MHGVRREGHVLVLHLHVGSAVPRRGRHVRVHLLCQVSRGLGKCEATIGCVYNSDAPEALPPMNEMYKSWIDKANEWANKPAAKKKSAGCAVL